MKSTLDQDSPIARFRHGSFIKQHLLIFVIIVVIFICAITFSFFEAIKQSSSNNVASLASQTVAPTCQPNSLKQSIAGYRQGIHISNLGNDITGLIIHWQNIGNKTCSVSGYIAVKFSDLLGNRIQVDYVKGLSWASFVAVPLPVNLAPHSGFASGAIFYFHYPKPPIQRANLPYFSKSCPKAQSITLGQFTNGNQIDYIAQVTVPSVSGANSSNFSTPCPRIVAASYFQSGSNADNDLPPTALKHVPLATTTTDPSMTTTSIASVSVQNCLPSQLSVQLSGATGSSNSSVQFMVFKNISSTNCALQGTPTVTMYLPDASPLPNNLEPINSLPGKFPGLFDYLQPVPPQRILMKANGQDVAEVGLFTTANPNSTVSCYSNLNLKVALPWSPSPVFVAGSSGVCSNPAEVSQFIQLPLQDIPPVYN
jgi:hypothetical protein